METKERMEREINLTDLFWNILFGWRQIICCGVIFAVLFSGIKYVIDNRNYKSAQNIEEDIVLTAEEEEQIESAKVIMERIENYQKYLGESALMQINPYEKPIVELQYYIESDYTYNYTRDNRLDYTDDLMSLYYNYVKSGEMSEKLIDAVDLPVNQADFSELCSVSQTGKTMIVTVTWAEEEKLGEISKFIKADLAKKETDFQEVGSHKLKLLRESQNIIADTDLAERKNTFSNSVAYINTQLDTLKSGMSEQQLKKLQKEMRTEDEAGNEKEVMIKPGFNFKYMILGAIGGAFLFCIWIAFKTIFAVKLQNAEEIRTLYNTRLLGEIAVPSGKKRFLSMVDDKLTAIKSRRKKKLSLEQQVKMIAANVTLLCKQQNIKKIYMTGSEYENIDVATLNMLKKEIADQSVQVIEGGNIFYDADSLRQGTEIGNILFVEQTGKSIYDEIFNELNLAQEQKNHILGVVVLI